MVLGHAAQADLFKFELLLEDTEWVFPLERMCACYKQEPAASAVSARSSQAAFGLIWQKPRLPWPHRNTEADCFAHHFWVLLDALVTSICIHHRLLAMQEISRRSEVVHIGGVSVHLMHEPSVLVQADVHVHPEIALFSLLAQMHLWVSFPIIIVLVPPPQAADPQLPRPSSRLVHLPIPRSNGLGR